MKIAIYGIDIKGNKAESIKQTIEALNNDQNELWLHQRFCPLLSNSQQKLVNQTFSCPDQIDESFDLFITIGGDGTILNSVRYVYGKNIPVAGINSGRLGFLTSIQGDTLEDGLKKLTNQQYTIESRTIIQADCTKQNSNRKKMYALNEITLHKLDNSSMITVDTKIDGEFLTKYWADGLIVATSTGSTAYSLSVGGPIVIPTLDSFVINAISPHLLTSRPVVVHDNIVIDAKVEGRGKQFMLTADHDSEFLDMGTTVQLKKAKHQFYLVRIEGEHFYKTLRSKLMWGADQRGDE